MSIISNSLAGIKKEKKPGQLSLKERIGYGAGDFASSMYWVIFAQFLMFFYTDVAGLPVAAVSTMLLATRLWDTVNDPVMGLLADRTKSKHGKYRPWLIWMIFPLIVSGVLVFAIPDGSTTFKLVYAFITYTLVGMMYTAINLPYAALMGVMTSNSQERTILGTFRYIGSFTGNFVPQLTLLALVAFIGRDNQQVGYAGTMVIYGLMAGALFFFTFKTTKERVKPVKTEKISIKADFRFLFKNKPWATIAIAGLLSLVGLSIKNAIAIYYFTYYVGDQSLVSSFLAVGTAAAMVGIVSTKWIIKICGGKRNAYIITNLLTAIGYAVFFIAKPENIALLFVIQALSWLVNGPVMPLMVTLYADTADYGEWKFGRRTTGLIYASGTAALKMGMTFGGAFCGWILAANGYIANVDQTPQTLETMRGLMSWIPALFAIAAVVVLYFYPLNKQKEEQMALELEQRRNSQESEESAIIAPELS